ncbi:HAD-IIIA family hydrolase [Leadbettera azotonutricia]|uniref:Nucleotidyl transferase domain-containing protein n=1 Tax=Leadbettera azotonutricia (strain ATCC BAA-888 / DSM 13862 / ZAS-9) TaxID=545695 RepID=F5YAV5_LEAAZ|nr:HAD-IIIA family hydrolase [Leadbettera azotonutricia]AEF82202.1 conserved hypothetical protein [Leadbettera azotonutricia ZAS-9]
MRAVIMAGGKGTRLLTFTRNQIPKPMAPVCGKPILQWQIECLKANSITEICIITGHLGETIQEYFGTGDFFGVSIQYFHENIPLGTAGAIAHIASFIKNENFLLVFGDTIFDIDIERMLSYHKKKNSSITLFVHPNSHPVDSDIVILDDNKKVIKIDSKNNIRKYWYNNIVNAGLYLISSKVIEDVPKSGKIDLEKDIISKKIEKNDEIYGYLSTEYIKDAGTIERISQIELDIFSGVVSAKNLLKKQKCIFLDRDGTINLDKGLIYKPDDLILEHTAVDAIKKINHSSYLAIVITNQPSVARGLCDIEDIQEIHRKLCTLLGQDGAFIDDIQFCPHHPDRGYPGENLEYKIPCQCRKPSIEMITRSAQAWNIDLSQSWIIGDTTVDIQTGKNAGLKTVLVKTGQAGLDGKFTASPDRVCKNILDAVNTILQGETS